MRHLRVVISPCPIKARQAIEVSLEGHRIEAWMWTPEGIPRASCRHQLCAYFGCREMLVSGNRQGFDRPLLIRIEIIYTCGINVRAPDGKSDEKNPLEPLDARTAAPRPNLARHLEHYVGHQHGLRKYHMP